MSNNKQSSIDLFIEQLEEKVGAWENASMNRIKISISVEEYLALKEQAKAMHKKEIWLCLNDFIETNTTNKHSEVNNEQQ